MLNPFLLATGGLVLASIAMTILWYYQKRTGNSDIVDVAWAGGVGGLGLTFAALSDGDPTRRWFISAVVIVWALRLSLYIWARVRSMPEDGRYTAMKDKWGDETDWRMFRFYQFQAFACLLFALPILIACWNPSALGWLDYFGLAVGVLAIGGESLADRQLNGFRKEPENKGKVCRNGLWNYSRHPNYFFEWLHWWAYVLFAVTYPWGWLTILGPALMYFFITRVTGIPPTEAQAVKSRGQAYIDYQNTTSAFFLWFPKTQNSTNPSTQQGSHA